MTCFYNTRALALPFITKTMVILTFPYLMLPWQVPCVFRSNSYRRISEQKYCHNEAFKYTFNDCLIFFCKGNFLGTLKYSFISCSLGDLLILFLPSSCISIAKKVCFICFTRSLSISLTVGVDIPLHLYDVRKGSFACLA